MPRKYDRNVNKDVNANNPKFFHLELPDEQKKAYETYQENDIVFFVGCAGTGKTFLALALAIQDILAKTRNKIVISRPIVEAGENLGFLPGDLNEKILPYMLPLYDCLEQICGKDTPNRRYVEERYELAPLAYMRGRTFSGSVCILDEAQNCSASQLKLFLTRLGKFSKMIITGDPSQDDLNNGQSGFLEVINKLKGIRGVGVHYFTEEAIMRHPLIAQIVKRI